MTWRLAVGLAFGAALGPSAPACAAQAPAAPAPHPEELVLEGDNIITVMINGVPLRLEVSGDSFGPPVINSTVAAQLELVPATRRGWRFGPVVVEGLSSVQRVDFGSGPVPMPVSWAARVASTVADGVIGVQNLPYDRVTFRLAPQFSDESVERFAMARGNNDGGTPPGAEVIVGKTRLMMIFAPQRAENLITAPTANFIATHQEGGFAPNSDGVAVMDFAVERPTRIMRIAYPIAFGSLPIDHFAVRIEDYGEPRRVGEIGENDPRFEPGRIVVSRRKGKGKPDLLTRIGRDQIAHCSRLTYDLAHKEIELSCAPLAE